MLLVSSFCRPTNTLVIPQLVLGAHLFQTNPQATAKTVTISSALFTGLMETKRFMGSLAPKEQENLSNRSQHMTKELLMRIVINNDLSKLRHLFETGALTQEAIHEWSEEF